MICERLLISGHGFQKIFERYITIDEIEAVIRNGEIIREYKEDKPYPSFLLLGFIVAKILKVMKVQPYLIRNSPIFVPKGWIVIGDSFAAKPSAQLAPLFAGNTNSGGELRIREKRPAY